MSPWLLTASVAQHRSRFNIGDRQTSGLMQHTNQLRQEIVELSMNLLFCRNVKPTQQMQIMMFAALVAIAINHRQTMSCRWNIEVYIHSPERGNPHQ